MRREWANSHLLVPSRGVQIRRGPELGELQLQGHARRVELGHGRRERLDPHGVPGGHAEEFSLHAVERDLPGLNLGMGPREENQIAELGVRDEVGVGGADERGVGERQILTRAVCDPQHRHGDLWMVCQAPAARRGLSRGAPQLLPVKLFTRRGTKRRPKGNRPRARGAAFSRASLFRAEFERIRSLILKVGLGAGTCKQSEKSTQMDQENCQSFLTTPVGESSTIRLSDANEPTNQMRFFRQTSAIGPPTSSSQNQADLPRCPEKR